MRRAGSEISWNRSGPEICSGESTRANLERKAAQLALHQLPVTASHFVLNEVTATSPCPQAWLDRTCISLTICSLVASSEYESLRVAQAPTQPVHGRQQKRSHLELPREPNIPYLRKISEIIFGIPMEFNAPSLGHIGLSGCIDVLGVLRAVRIVLKRTGVLLPSLDLPYSIGPVWAPWQIPSAHSTQNGW